jgi:hypothetical protein
MTKEMLSEELLLEIKSHNDKGLYFEQYDPSPVIDRMYHDIRSLQSTIAVLESEAGIDALIRSYEHRVNTLTEALRSCVWELQQWVKSFHPEAHDEGKKIAHRVIEKSYKALQSIKKSPR